MANGDRAKELADALMQANLNYEEANMACDHAVKTREEARQCVNDVQSELDEYIRNVRESAPVGTNWNDT